MTYILRASYNILQAYPPTSAPLSWGPPLNLPSNACNQQFIVELTVFPKNIFVPNTSTGVDNLIIVIVVSVIMTSKYTDDPLTFTYYRTHKFVYGWSLLTL